MFGVPAVARGEKDPAKQYDTSNGNRFTGNTFGVRPDGTPDPQRRSTSSGTSRACATAGRTTRRRPARRLTSDPPSLPTCASGGSSNPIGNAPKLAADLPCISLAPAGQPGPARLHVVHLAEGPGLRHVIARFGGVRVLAAAALAVAALVAGAVALAGGGEDGAARSTDGAVRWDGEPRLLKPPELPRDRVLAGRLKNVTVRQVRLDVREARLLDADGRELQSTITFASGFAHGLYSPRNTPEEPEPEFEARRLGNLAVLEAGQTTPFTLSWRLPEGASPPVHVDLGLASIPVPPTT